MLAAGMTSRGVMAELTGREGGYARGKGGSMHMFSREKNFFGGHGIVGAQVPLGTGLAFCEQVQGPRMQCPHRLFRRRRVQPGPGLRGVQHGPALWKLPVVYVIENNQYAMGTIDRALVGSRPNCSSAAYRSRSPARKFDGMDVLAVRKAAAKAVKRARDGDGPLHPRDEDLSLSRPLHVRPGEVSHARGSAGRCANIATRSTMLKKKLLDAKHVTEDDLKKIEAEVKRDRE